MPNLQSYEENSIEIDPTGLPVDARIANTRQTVVPAARSGVVVKCGVDSKSATALVGFVDLQGRPLPLGTSVTVDPAEPAVVGYDGQVFLDGLRASNTAAILLPDSNSCSASFGFDRKPGRQVLIEKVPCQ